jgi:hypothetical protein
LVTTATPGVNFSTRAPGGRQPPLRWRVRPTPQCRLPHAKLRRALGAGDAGQRHEQSDQQEER